VLEDKGTPPETTYVPHRSDWKLTTKITKKQSFDSGGATVELKVIPKYVGKQPYPKDGVVEITYTSSQVMRAAP
jgi:hypothetical protein